VSSDELSRSCTVSGESGWASSRSIPPWSWGQVGVPANPSWPIGAARCYRCCRSRNGAV